MKTTKPKSKPRTSNIAKPKAEVTQIQSHLHLFQFDNNKSDAENATEIFRALTGKSK